MSRSGTKTEQLQESEPLSLVAFYLLAFAISWLGFAPAIAGSLGSKWFLSRWWQAALILPGIGPAAAAWIVSVCFASSGGDGNGLIRLKRSFLRRVSFRWWTITVTLAISIMLLASVLSRNQHQGSTTHRPSGVSLLLFSIFSIAANPLEEIGWRGFAQARLQKTHKALSAALIVGGLWAVWHIPLFFLSGSTMAMSHISFWPWAAGVFPQSILLAWLYNRTGYSLATVSVFHVLGNIAGDALCSSTAMVSAVRATAALIVLLVDGPDLEQHSISIGLEKRPSRKQRLGRATG